MLFRSPSTDLKLAIDALQQRVRAYETSRAPRAPSVEGGVEAADQAKAAGIVRIVLKKGTEIARLAV